MESSQNRHKYRQLIQAITHTSARIEQAQKADLSSAEFEPIINMLQKMSPSPSLNLTHCNLSNLSDAELSSLMHTIGKKHITELDLSRNDLYQLRGTQLAHVVDELKFMRTLTNLSLRGNFLRSLTPADWRQWGNVLRNIKKLNIGKNRLGETHLRQEALMDSKSWQALTNELSASCIEHLNLSDNLLNRINDREIWRMIARTIAHMRSLKSVNLCGNHLILGQRNFLEILAEGFVRNTNHPTIIIDWEDDEKFWLDLHNQCNVKVVYPKTRNPKPRVITHPTDAFSLHVYDLDA